MHRRIAATAMLDLALAADGVFHRIRRAVFAADEPFERGSAVAAGFTTASNRQNDAADHHTSQPKSIHCFSPVTREPRRFYKQLRCQCRPRENGVISPSKEYPSVPARARARTGRCKKVQLGRARRRSKRACLLSAASSPSASAVPAACSSARSRSLRRCS